jgi:hypothetical protein
VVDFRAPAPPTQAAFFFFATEMMNPCMWSTDSDTQQVPYVPGNLAHAAACPGCAVRPSLGQLAAMPAKSTPGALITFAC